MMNQKQIEQALQATIAVVSGLATLATLFVASQNERNPNVIDITHLNK